MAKTKTIQVPVSDEDKIFGKSEKTIIKTVIDYESEDIKYKVSNLLLENTPTIVNGKYIEAFIGSSNIEARNALKDGKRTVITFDSNGEEAFKIEVID